MAATVAHLVHQQIESVIRMLRGEKVILDEDLAALYGVDTKTLVRAVKRNLKRFPDEFMFQLSAEEFQALRYQIGTSNKGRGGRRYAPYAFTEHGVAMLSSVLNSEQAIQVNIEVIKTFVKLRRILTEHVELSRKLNALERRYDSQFKMVFDAIRELMTPLVKPARRIGFKNE
jgi:phage regulator Rha-like protein